MRVLYDIRNMVLYGRHALDLPETMMERPAVIRTRYLALKRRVAKTLMMDEGGVQFMVSDYGTGQQAEKDRSNVESWTQGMHANMRELFPTIESDVVDDLLVHSVTGMVVLPRLESLEEAPALDLDRVSSLTEYDIDEIEREVNKHREKRDEYTAAHTPFYWRHVPAESMIASYTARGGLAEVVIIETIPVLDIIREWPECETTLNARDVYDLTDDDTVTMIHRLDHSHCEIAILDIS